MFAVHQQQFRRTGLSQQRRQAFGLGTEQAYAEQQLTFIQPLAQLGIAEVAELLRSARTDPPLWIQLLELRHGAGELGRAVLRDYGVDLLGGVDLPGARPGNNAPQQQGQTETANKRCHAHSNG